MDSIVAKIPTRQRTFARSPQTFLLAVGPSTGEPTPPTFTSYTEALRNHADASAYFGPYSPEATRALMHVSASCRA